MFYSMWCCLLGAALRVEGAKEWFRLQTPQQVAKSWDSAAKELQTLAPLLTPSCTQITVHAMLRYPLPSTK